MESRTADKLDVPLILQDDPTACAPTCVKMVIDYLNTSGMLQEPIANLSIADISRIVDKQRDGTHFHNIRLINSSTIEAVPSVEFIPEYSKHSLKDIRDELDEKRPVILWVMLTPDGVNDLVHAIVITKVDMSAQRIHYNDPFFGKRTIDLGKFYDMWDKEGNILIKVQIGKQQRKVLEEWFPKGERQ